MSNWKKPAVYALIFLTVTVSSYTLMEFTIKDTIVAAAFAGSGASISNAILFGFASTMLVSFLLGVATTLYIYRNEDRILSRLRVQ
jgi:hypothetical protein